MTEAHEGLSERVGDEGEDHNAGVPHAQPPLEERPYEEQRQRSQTRGVAGVIPVHRLRPAQRVLLGVQVGKRPTRCNKKKKYVLLYKAGFSISNRTAGDLLITAVDIILLYQQLTYR